MSEKLKASIPIDIDEIGGLLYLEPRMIDVRLDLKSIPVEPNITLVEQSKLIDISNIPMLEYSNMFIEDKNSPVNTYAKAILGNYDNRSIVQNQLVEDEIGEEFGLVDSAVLWLEAINNNLNQLMGLVSVNNYLLGMMGAGVGQSKEIINTISQMYSEESKRSWTDILVDFATVVGTGSAVGSALGAIVGTIISPGPGTAIGGAAGGLKGAEIGALLYAQMNLLDMDLSKFKEVAYEKATDWVSKGFEFFKPAILSFEDIVSGKTKKDKTYGETTDYKKLGSWDYIPPGNDTEIITSYSYYETLSTFIGKKRGETSTEKDETNYLQGIDRQGLTGLAIAVLNSEQLDVLKPYKTSGTDTAKRFESGASMSSEQSLTVSENKTSTNASISEDLTNSTYSENKYAPQKSENIYEVQVSNNFDMKITKDVDYQDITRYVTNSIAGAIIGLKATTIPR